VSPVKYELGFYIPEDAILHSDRRENLKSSPYGLPPVVYRTGSVTLPSLQQCVCSRWSRMRVATCPDSIIIIIIMQTGARNC
jgi:hypothetical protein